MNVRCIYVNQYHLNDIVIIVNITIMCNYCLLIDYIIHENVQKSLYNNIISHWSINVHLHIQCCLKSESYELCEFCVSMNADITFYVVMA